MAESEQGIHPEVVKHLMEHNRRISTLELKDHDKHADSAEDQEMMGNLHSAVTELTTAIRELIQVMKEDVKSDKAVANERSGKRKPAGAESGAGDSPPKA